ncbi:MAG: methyltransferase domain-containing protein [Pseudomonadota bacterium]
MDNALTRDAYLGGRVMLWQPARGYRAGVDPVLLAAACPARPGDTVLELGCGVGTAALCLAARVPDLMLTGIERQTEMAALAHRNAIECEAQMDVVCADIADLPDALRQRSWDHVIANPPYFDRARSLSSNHEAREAAMGEDTPLETWVDVATRRLKPRGWVTLIHRPERMAELLRHLDGRMGSVSILPLVPREGREASLILLRARKEGRGPLRLLSPLILHQGNRHESDAEDYTDQVSAVLRCGAAIPSFGD